MNVNDKKRDKAVVTVVGRDDFGILAKTATTIAAARGNIEHVTQQVMDEFFTMSMVVDITELTCSSKELETAIKAELPGFEIHVMHENIFSSMHTI